LRKLPPNQNKALDYSTMNKEELMRMPIENISKEESFLWIWATNSKDKKNKRGNIKNGF